jgi:hypothetical protein
LVIGLPAANGRTNTVTIEKNKRDTETLEELDEARELFSIGLRQMMIVGIPSFGSIASVVPFLAGYPLHKYFYTIGRPLLLVAMFLWTLFMLSVGQVLFLWSDVREIKKSETRKR